MNLQKSQLELNAAALAACRILDTPPEEEYEDLTQLASMICKTPISLISLIDGDRQWFKSARGLEVRQTPSNISFCVHAIANQDQVMVIPDATKDVRFATNPLVISDPNVRLYAGAPLVLKDGSILGTICVIDRLPRHLDDFQIQSLKRLGRQASLLLEYRRALVRLADTREDFLKIASNLEGTEKKYKTLLDHQPIAVVQSDADTGEIVDLNQAAVELYDYPKFDLVSQRLTKIFGPSPGEEPPLSGGRRAVHIRQDGSTIPVEVRSSTLEIDDRRVRVDAIIEANSQTEIEQGLLDAFDFSPVGMALILPNDRICRANDALCHFLGRGVEELFLSSFSAFVDPADLDRFQEELAPLFSENRKSINLRMRFMDADGGSIAGCLTGTLVRYEVGQPVQILVQILKV